MQHFNDEDVNHFLNYPSLIEALRREHAQGGMPQTYFNVAHDSGHAHNTFVTQFAWKSGDAVAMKLDGLFPDNASLIPPRPTVQGVVLLLCGKTGTPLASCTGSGLTLYKTAADSALAADFLSRRDAQTMLMIGAGSLAPHVIAAMRCVRPSLNKILIWNRNQDRARQLADKLQNEGCPAYLALDLEDAQKQADIISCATMATDPLVYGRLLKPGCHVDLIGAYTPQMREADDDVIARAGQIFVDNRINCETSGDVSAPLASGILKRENIIADLFDLCQMRHPGRQDETEITVYKNAGGGHLDMFTIKHLLEQSTLK